MEKKIMRDARRDNMLITAVLWSVFGVCAMAIMIFTASRKTIIIANVDQEQVGISQHMGEDDSVPGKELSLRLQDAPRDNFHIPLAKGVKAEDVVMENRYMEHELWIYIENVEKDFYENNAIYGDTARVQAGYFEKQKNGVILKLQMTGVYEYNSTMEGDNLTLVSYEPWEVYEHIVVIDPIGGGDNKGIVAGEVVEKDVALQVAKLLQKKMNTDACKLYFTRLSDEDVELERRAMLAKEVRADCYIALGISANEEQPQLYGIEGKYNDTYFIPEFGNVALADVLTRNVTIASSNRAVGLVPIEESGEDVLSYVTVPAAEISMGYATNEQENALLRQENYQDKLAQGLAEAIAEVYTNKEFVE